MNVIGTDRKNSLMNFHRDSAVHYNYRQCPIIFTFSSYENDNSPELSEYGRQKKINTQRLVICEEKIVRTALTTVGGEREVRSTLLDLPVNVRMNSVWHPNRR